MHVFCQFCGTEVLTTPDHSGPYICSDCSLQEESNSVDDFIPLPVEDEDESYIGLDVKTLTVQQLQKALADVDEDRKQHCRDLRGKTWSPDDEDLMGLMDDWAKKVFDELQSR